MAHLSNTTSPSGNVLVVTGRTETILNGCDLNFGPVAMASLTWNIWISQNRNGVQKQATLRLRRTNTSGEILASAIVGDNGDSTSGHQSNVVGGFDDVAATDGHYVLTIQETLGDNLTEIWSDTRTFDADSPIPPVAPSPQRLEQYPLEMATINVGQQSLSQFPLEMATDNVGLQTLSQFPLETAVDMNGQQIVTQFLLEFAYVPPGPGRIGFVLSASKP